MKISKKVVWLTLLFITVGVVIARLCGDLPIPYVYNGTGNQAPNCYGYAQARAFGKEDGDPECDPAKVFAQKIYTQYFPYEGGSSLSGIYAGCIVVFGEERDHPDGHAAYVVYVPNPLTEQNKG